MNSKKVQTYQKDRFLKLSLKKNRVQSNQESDVVVINDTFDELETDLLDNVQSSLKEYSPIIINDSSELSYKDICIRNKKPSQNGNVSFNQSMDNSMCSPQTQSRPSTGGWSPAQNIVCATPKYTSVPSTNKDLMNESMEQCSIKKIQLSQQELLNDLYGEVWKSIPKLFKPPSNNNLGGVSKKLDFIDDESDKENVRNDIRKLKQDLLTESEVKRRVNSDLSETNKRSKKKLYTEKVPCTPDLRKQKPDLKRTAKSTTKKNRHMTVTELVGEMIKDIELITKKVDDEVTKKDTDVLTKKGQKTLKDIDLITKKVEKVTIAPTATVEINRLSFVGSLADNVPSWRCNFEAMQYIDNYKNLKDQLTRRLYTEFNEGIFGKQLDEDMPIIWDSKLRSTAGTTTNRLLKTSSGNRIRTSTIKLSTKVLDRPQRLRDTLVHELCHAATWLVDGELRAGHGPLWKRWATKALQCYPELGEISRCHDMEIHYKYCFKCTKCGYSVQRHSKSIDITKKCCGYCRGAFELIVNKKKKDGAIVSTPARKGGPNEFALYVKENYATVKDASKTHRQVMKLLGEQYSAKKNKIKDTFEVDSS